MSPTVTETLLRASLQIAKQQRLIAAQRAYILVLREKLGERNEQRVSMFHRKQAG